MSEYLNVSSDGATLDINLQGDWIFNNIPHLVESLDLQHEAHYLWL